VHRLGVADPARWLAAGWRDLRAAPAVSLGYGLAFATIGFLLTVGAWHLPVLVLTFVSGFLLVAPVLAIGLYDASRRLERGERPRFADLSVAWRGNGWSVVFFGVLLGLAMLAWGRLTGVLAALLLPATGPESYLVNWNTLLSADGAGFFLYFAVMGALLAGFVFAISAVAIPMMLDRPADALTAAVTSLKVVRHNPLPMLVWSALIVALTLLGMATFYVGLVVVLPLLGHATWHAYRAAVGPQSP
jgi:uncharacterized membrane protein